MGVIGYWYLVNTSLQRHCQVYIFYVLNVLENFVTAQYSNSRFIWLFFTSHWFIYFSLFIFLLDLCQKYLLIIQLLP